MPKTFARFKERLFADITTIPPILNTDHLRGLDGLRGISILLVLLSHLTRGSYDAYNFGGVGVETFFVISGFLITTLLLKEKVKYGRIDLKNFYIRRVLRIFPVAYLFLLVLLVLNHYYHLSITTKSFLTAALYLKNIPVDGSGEWYTGHFWSLSVEEQFYILFPILLMRNINRYVLIVFSFVLLIPIVEAIGYNNIFQANKISHVITYTFINVFGKGTISILIGSLASVLVFKGVITTKHLRTNNWMGLALLSGVIILNILVYKVYISPIIFAAIVSFVILNNLERSTLLLTILQNGVLKKIGVLSYSLYIWQQLFTYYPPWGGAFKYAGAPVLNMIALALVAAASYYLYEIQFLKLKQKFISKPAKA